MSGIADIINAYNARITAHLEVGKLLAGWEFSTGPKEFSQGKDAFPAVACWLPETEETADRTQCRSSLTLNYTIAVERTASSVTLETAKQLFLNALDTNPTTNKVEPIYGDFDASTFKAGVTANCIEVWIKIKPKHLFTFNRGQRT